MVSIAGSIILSIIANLLTPSVSAFVTRHLHAKQSGVRKKQIQRRDQVLTLQVDLFRRTGAKLDAIFKLLLAIVLLTLCVFSFQFGSGSLDILAMSKPSTQLQIPVLLIVLVGVFAAIAVGKLGLDDMALALTADRRERASDDFVKQHDSATTEEMKRFEDEWDLRQFGVNSHDVDPTSINERA
jgi:hypothetical protein